MWPSRSAPVRRFITLSNTPKPGDDLRRLLAAQQQILEEIRRAIQANRAEVVIQQGDAVPVEVAATLLGCGRTRVFELLAQGALQPATKAGRKRMVTRASIEAVQRAPGSGSRGRSPARTRPAARHARRKGHGDAIRRLR